MQENKATRTEDWSPALSKARPQGSVLMSTVRLWISTAVLCRVAYRTATLGHRPERSREARGDGRALLASTTAASGNEHLKRSVLRSRPIVPLPRPKARHQEQVERMAAEKDATRCCLAAAATKRPGGIH